MTIVMHWGIGVDSTIPVTGVLNSGRPEWLHEDMFNGIDLDFEEHCKECDQEYHDDCYCDDGDTTYLIGYFKDEETGLFDIDKSAEYSAIVCTPYTQVTRSKFVSKTALCSPCYPGQGDLDTPGEFLAFTLPPEVWGSAKHLEIIKLEEGDEIGEP